MVKRAGCGVALAAAALVAGLRCLVGAWLARAAFRRDLLAPGPGGPDQAPVTEDPQT